MTLPIAALHGFTGSPASFDAVMALLGSSDAATLAPALLGHHGAQRDGDVRSFEGEVDRLARLLAERAPRWHLVGYSLGGRVALGLLVRHPSLFESALLVGAQPGLDDEAARAGRRAADAEWCRLLDARGIEPFVDAWQAQPLFATQRGLPPAVLDARRAERLGHDARGLLRCLEVLGLGAMPSYWGALDRLTVPTTLMVGELDPKFTEIAERMRARMRAASIEVVPGAGHDVVLERPDAVARALGSRLGPSASEARP
jgi:2-succinyl-6-hydroxy-2,4-cyclohexadiene-1-carboxylate synthase